MIKLNYFPTRGHIFCEILSSETISSGGIILAKTLKERPFKGKVISVGAPTINTCRKCEDKGVCHSKVCYKKNKELKAPCKQGDIVYFKSVWGRTIKDKYIFLNFMDVIGVTK